MLLSLNSIFAKKNKITDVLFLGDSLTEGYGVPKNKSFPIIAINKLKDVKPDITMLNGSVSGSTSASAVSRVKWFSKVNPKILFLSLGANDGLRGIDVKETQKNLEAAIKLAVSKGMVVILAGMKAPPNYGAAYSKGFSNIFKKLASRYKLIYIPFLLDKIAGVKEYNQNDGIHPNEKGHEIMAETILPFLKQSLGLK
jgi:acyl-CoA thioesterase-1